ncbi:MAG: hypothetical protein SGILL_006974 [Bacillariaceae sp.]
MTQIILRVEGPRVPVEIAEANALVERFESSSENNEVIGIDLSCRQWKQPSLEIVETFLQAKAATVKYLVIDDIIAGLLTDEGLAVTEKLANVFLQSNLLQIDLADNAMGPRGLGRVGALFQNSNLQRLNLNNCGLSHESMGQLEGYLMEDDWRIAKCLRSLSLDRNMIGIDGAQIVGRFLPHCTNLESFSYKGSRPQGPGSKFLAQGLLGLVDNVDIPAIRALHFEDCTFGSGEDDDEGGIIPFTQAISKCAQLQHLDMKESLMEVTGVTLLVDALKESKARLTDLLLDANGEVGPEGAKVLSEWLVSQVETLRRLHLSTNELGDEGVAAIMVPFFAPSNVLEDVSFELNELTDEGADTLLTAKLPKLRHLNLDDNMDIEDEKKHELLSKFGKDVVFFGDEEDDMDDLVAKMAGSSI